MGGWVEVRDSWGDALRVPQYGLARRSMSATIWPVDSVSKVLSDIEDVA